MFLFYRTWRFVAVFELWRQADVTMSIKSDAVLIVPEAGKGGTPQIRRSSALTEAYKNDGKDVIEAVRDTYKTMDDGLEDDSGLETTPQSSSSSSHNNSTRVHCDDIERLVLDLAILGAFTL